MTAETVLNNPQSLRPLPYEWFEPDGDTLPYRDNISVFDDGYERVFTVHREAVPVAVKALQDAYTLGETRFRHFNLHALGEKSDWPGRAFLRGRGGGLLRPDELFRLRNALIVSFLFGMLLMALSGWYFAGRALAPVSRLMDEVNTLQPTDLSRRIAPGRKTATNWLASLTRSTACSTGWSRRFGCSGCSSPT